MGRIAKCALCRVALPTAATTGGTGYAIIYGARRRRKICYPCADQRERKAMGKATKLTAYLSGDGRRVTTWTGGKLADVILTKRVKHWVPGAWRYVDFSSIRARDERGGEWIGRGQPGMYIKLRRVKSWH